MSKELILPTEFEQNKDIGIIKTEEVNNCPVCNSTSFQTYTYGYDYEIQTCKNKWKFVKCDDCTHIWLNPRPHIEELATIYPPNYYAYDYESQISPLAVKGKELLDAAKFNGILKHRKDKVNSFCDIGCGTGRFLRLMESKGVKKENNYGLELEDDSLKQLRKDGFQVFTERVEDCDKIKNNSLDLATMFHVIEHVDNPKAVIKKVADWLAPGGIFALETPNINSLDAKKYKDAYWGGYHIPRHWNLFTEETLNILLKESGLELVDVKYQTGHSFWMYSNHHTIRYEKENPQKAEKYNPFKKEGLGRLVMYTAYDILRNRMLGQKTSAMLLIARK